MLKQTKLLGFLLIASTPFFAISCDQEVDYFTVEITHKDLWDIVTKKEIQEDGKWLDVIDEEKTKLKTEWESFKGLTSELEKNTFLYDKAYKKILPKKPVLGSEVTIRCLLETESEIENNQGEKYKSTTFNIIAEGADEDPVDFATRQEIEINKMEHIRKWIDSSRWLFNTKFPSVES